LRCRAFPVFAFPRREYWRAQAFEIRSGPCPPIGMAHAHSGLGAPSQILESAATMRKHRRSLAQPCGSADAGIAAFIKSKSPVGRARNSDAHALADGLGRPSGGAQPE